MSKLWIIAANEYRTNVRRTGFIVMTLVVPFIGLVALLVSAIAGGRIGAFFENQIEGNRKPVGVVDELGAFTPMLEEFRQEYRAFPSEETAREAIKTSEVNTVLVIPPDYLERCVIRVLSTESTLGTLESISEERIRSFLTAHLLHGKVDEQLYTRVRAPVTFEQVDLSQATGEAGKIPTIGDTLAAVMVPYFLGILLVVAIFTSSGYLMQSVTEEKSNRVMEIILSSVSADTLLAGKIIGMGALGLTQVLFWLLCVAGLSLGTAINGPVLPLLEQPASFVLIVVYFLLGFMIYAVLMGLAGSLGTTQQEAQQISSLFSMLAAVPLFFAGFILQNPNAGIARALSYIPFTAPTMMLLRIPLGNPPIIDYVLSLTITALCIPLLLAAGAKVFRLGLLVYGKRPSLAVIWKTIRQA